MSRRTPRRKCLPPVSAAAPGPPSDCSRMRRGASSALVSARGCVRGNGRAPACPRQAGAAFRRAARCHHGPFGRKLRCILNPGQPAAVLTGVGAIGTLKGLELEEEADAGRGCSRLPTGKGSAPPAPDGPLVQDGNNHAARLGIAAPVHAGTLNWLTGGESIGHTGHTVSGEAARYFRSAQERFSSADRVVMRLAWPGTRIPAHMSGVKASACKDADPFLHDGNEANGLVR
jgi:hypothetical protein